MKNNIKAVLFDLDGTLLPMNLTEFMGEYFKILYNSLEDEKYSKDELYKGVHDSIIKMITSNDGKRTNAEQFLENLNLFFDGAGERIVKRINRIYSNEYIGLRRLCGLDEAAAVAVRALSDAGYKLVLATNPVFPMEAQLTRLSWTGVDASLFDYVTSYENSRSAKPHKEYYEYLLDDLGISASEAIMVGNDTLDDMVAEEAGLDTFLLTACLINRDGRDISKYKNGDFSDLLNYLI